MDQRAMECSPARAPLSPELLLPGHRYVTLPPLGARRLLVSAPSRVERWRLARSTISWGSRRTGAHRAALRAAAALSSGWCLVSGGRTPPTHPAWRDTTFDRELRSVVEDATSAVVFTVDAGRRRVGGVLTGPSGSVFVKAVDGNTTALANEARMLREVGVPCAPRLLREYVEADAGFIVIENVCPDYRRPSLVPDARGIGLLESLDRHGEETAENHPWIASLLTSASPPDVARWSEVLHSRRWPLVVFHGDYSPWNLATRPNGEPVLLDWEFGSLAGFPGVDAASWVITVGAVFGHESADSIASVFTSWACDRECGGIRIGRDEARAILALTAYRQYRGHMARQSDSDHAQQVRASLWAYDSA